MRSTFTALAVVAGVLSAGPGFAGHHSWDFTEIFSNADGSVQFIEMDCPSDNEAGLGAFTITAGSNTLNFVTNLPSTSTANTWVLIATSGFGSLTGGVVPDYVIPADFFATGGGTLNYASGADIWNYGAVPTDGVNALLRNGSTATNSPTNFAGQTGSVDLTAQIPTLETWGFILLVGAMLLAAVTLLRRRQQVIPA